MAHAWKLLTNEARRKDGPDLDKFTELALTFYFYYVNFGPLSRGTAATGVSCAGLCPFLRLRLCRCL